MKKILLIIALSVSTLGFYQKSFAANVLPDLYIGGAVVHQNLDHSIDSIVFTICNSGGYFKSKGVAIRLDFTVEANVANQNGLEFYRDLSIRTSYCTGVTIEGEEVLQGRQLPVLGKVNSGLVSVYSDIQESSLSNNTSAGVEVYYSNKTNSVNSKDKYYGLIKDIYYRLYNAGYFLSYSLYQDALSTAYNQIYNAGSDPKMLYNQALEIEKNFNNVSRVYDLEIKDPVITYDDNKISKIEFQVCNIGTKGFYGQLSAFISFYKNYANFASRSQISNQVIEYYYTEKIDPSECKTHTINESKIAEYMKDYKDYKFLLKGPFYATIRIGSGGDTGEVNYENNITSAGFMYTPSTSSNTSITRSINTTRSLQFAQARAQAIYAELYSLGYINQSQYDRFMKQVETSKNKRLEISKALRVKKLFMN